MNNIDPLNYILLDVLNTVNPHNMKLQNNAAKFEGYYLDIERTKRNVYRFKIRTEFLQTLCTLIVNKSSYALKYSTDFVWEYKNGKFKTNLSSDPILADDLPEYLNKLSTKMDFDVELFISVLIKCTEIHSEIEFA